MSPRSPATRPPTDRVLLPSHDLLHLRKVGYPLSQVYKAVLMLYNSDLHMYEGRTGAEPGIVFGHEKYVNETSSIDCRR